MKRKELSLNYPPEVTLRYVRKYYDAVKHDDKSGIELKRIWEDLASITEGMFDLMVKRSDGGNCNVN